MSIHYPTNELISSEGDVGVPNNGMGGSLKWWFGVQSQDGCLARTR